MNIYHTRCYNNAPYTCALIHGGPGAPGTMASLARLLESHTNVLELLQSADSIAGQIEELKVSLDHYTSSPIVLLGHSWGAWLSLLFAAKHPDMVRKLILVCSGPFEAHYASSIMPTRIERLTADERKRCDELMRLLTSGTDDPAILSEFGALMSKSDTYEPLDTEHHGEDTLPFQSLVYEKIWSEASKLRSTHQLLDAAQMVSCPVIAIHGDYDPHPYLGVKDPLESVVKQFEFILLDRCGHTPWMETYARDPFIQIISEEINT